MGRKRRSRRSRKRFRFVVTILIFSFATLLFLNTQLPLVLNPQKLLFNTISTGSTFKAQKPRTWFRKDGQAPTSTTDSSPKSQSSETGASSLSSSAQALEDLRLREIPKGPYPLTPLNKSESAAHEGTAWAASLRDRETSNLPLHWLAELLHSQPKTPVQPTNSIFTARRKGAWIGCDRSAWLICKGAYKAIKKTNAITLVDTCCGDNITWLPNVIEKLRLEFRLVRLTCIGKRVEGYDENVKFLEIDPLTGALPNGTDLLLAFKFVQRGTLISAMKFFKNVKKAGVKYLVTENYPEEENVVKTVNNENMLRLNGAMPPFWFPAPEYEYENAEENTEDVVMQITVARVGELFEERLTPGMAELIDPRKRTVRE